MGVVVQRDGGSVHQDRSADSHMLGHLCCTSPALRRVAGRPGPSLGTTAPPGARGGPDNGATGPVQLCRERWRRRGPCSARRPSPAGVGEWGMGPHVWSGPSVGRTGGAGRSSSASPLGRARRPAQGGRLGPFGVDSRAALRRAVRRRAADGPCRGRRDRRSDRGPAPAHGRRGGRPARSNATPRYFAMLQPPTTSTCAARYRCARCLPGPGSICLIHGHGG